MKSNIIAKDSTDLVFNGWRIKEEADLVYFEGGEVTGGIPMRTRSCPYLNFEDLSDFMSGWQSTYHIFAPLFIYEMLQWDPEE